MKPRKLAVRKKVDSAYHHGDLKASLKKAALCLVREKGPRGFSLNEASRLAGVTVAAPYRHFADKDALLAEVACDGCELMASELIDAIANISGTEERMLAAGMAYLRFSVERSDYFVVMFQAGLNKTQYPQLRAAAGKAFAVIHELSSKAESTPELAEVRAVSAWALVHGLAALLNDGALATVLDAGPQLEMLRPILCQFLGQSYRERGPHRHSQSS